MNTNNDIESFFYKNEEPKSLSKAQIGIKLIFHGLLIIVLPVLLISLINNIWIELLLFGVWCSTINYISLIIQKNITDKIFKYNIMNINNKQQNIHEVKVHYLELVFVQPPQRFLDNSRAKGVYYKKDKDWIYTKIDTPSVSFSIQLNELQDIHTIISQFKDLNPTFILSTVKYI